MTTEPERSAFIIQGRSPQAKARLSKAILPACKAANLAWRRVDALSFGGNVGQAIFAEIERAALVIADIVEKNPNVFYELGVTHALNKPSLVIGEASFLPAIDLMSQRIVPFDGSLPSLREDLRSALMSLLAEVDRKPDPTRTPNTMAQVRSVVVGDIEASSELIVRLGESESSASVVGFLRRLREAADRRGVLLFSSVGDGFLATFLTTSAAFAFAQEAMSFAGGTGASSQWPLALRISMDRGMVSEVQSRYGPDIVGEALAVAARLVGAGAASEIVISASALADLPHAVAESGLRRLSVRVGHEATVQAVVLAPGRAPS